MSTSLIKKSLELFKDDIEETQVKKKKKNDPMKMISTKRKGICRELRQLNKKLEFEKQMKLNRQKSKSAAVDAAKHRPANKLVDNLMLIKKFSRFNSTNSKVAETIIKHHKGKLSKNNPLKVEDKEVQKSILFPDTDIDKDEESDHFSD